MAHREYQIHKGTWIEIEHPTEDDLQYLRERFPAIHPTNLEDSMQRVNRSKLDAYDSYIFMSVAVPIRLVQGKKATNFEFSFFLLDDTLITVTHEKTEMFKQEHSEEDTVATMVLPETPALLTYRFLEILYDTSFKTIDRINSSIAFIDDNILNVTSSAIIRDISILQRNIIYFMTTLHASIPLFEELESKDVRLGSSTSMKEYWGDLVDKLKQQRDVLEDYDILLSKLAKSHENYLGYHTNHVIHILTVFSVIFLPLNLIAGIYGMNFVHLPIAGHPVGFFLTLLFMAIVAGIMIGYFKFKKWI